MERNEEEVHFTSGICGRRLIHACNSTLLGGDTGITTNVRLIAFNEHQPHKNCRWLKR